MASSPAGVLLGRPPKSDHDRWVMLVALAVVAVLGFVSMAVALITLVRRHDENSTRSAGGAVTTTVTYRPAPPVLRVAPAQPDFVR